jgi:serine/threonine-protein kinase
MNATSNFPQRPSVTLPERENVRSLGRYSLIAQIGRGGMGVIYLALVRGPAGFNKLFVVKELKPELSADPEVVSLFLEEARLSARMNHANVVQTIEVGSEDDHHFMAMEYLEGQSLVEIRERCTDKGIRLAEELALQITIGALEGLQYAHTSTGFDGSGQGVVHRDVSPHNLFVTYDGTVKVLDFGIAKTSSSAQHTETGVLKGKVAYMAPEQAAGQPIDRRIDVFAVGVILWEALAGRRMWGDSAADMSILHSLWNQSIPDLCVARPEISPVLARIVKKATEADPNQRYQTASEMQLALEEYAATLEGPSGARELGKFVAEHFKRDRADIKARIDGQIKLLENIETADGADIGMARVYSDATPLGTSIVKPRYGGSSGSTGSTTGRRVQPLQAGPTHPTRVVTPWIVSGAATALVLAGGWFALHKGPAEPTAVRPAAPPSQIAAPAPAAPSVVRVTLAATPAAAHILVDGKAVAGNPFAGTFPAGSAAHTVRAEAAGYEPSSVELFFDEDRAVNLALRPADPQPAAPPSRSPSRATSAPAPAPTPHGAHKKDDLEPF